jgi:hypothetical protein
LATGIKFLLEQIEVLEPVRKKLDAQITKLAAQLPAYMFTLPRATELTIVSLYGEVDSIDPFQNLLTATIVHVIRCNISNGLVIRLAAIPMHKLGNLLLHLLRQVPHMPRGVVPVL